MGKPLICSVCGKNEHQVRKMLSGPVPFSVCDECVELLGVCLKDMDLKPSGVPPVQCNADLLKKVHLSLDAVEAMTTAIASGEADAWDKFRAHAKGLSHLLVDLRRAGIYLASSNSA